MVDTVRTRPLSDRRPARDQEEETMKALRFYAPEDVRLVEVPEPGLRARPR